MRLPYILFCLLLISLFPATGQKVVFVVEAGQSMLNPWPETTQSRIEVARNAFWQTAMMEENRSTAWEFLAPGGLEGDSCSDVAVTAWPGGALKVETLRETRASIAALKPTGRANVGMALDQVLSVGRNSEFWLAIDGDTNCGASLCQRLSALVASNQNLNVLYLASEIQPDLQCLTNHPNVQLVVDPSLSQLSTFMEASFTAAKEQAEIERQQTAEARVRSVQVPQINIGQVPDNLSVTEQGQINSDEWSGQIVLTMIGERDECLSAFDVIFPDGSTLSVSSSDFPLDLKSKIRLNERIGFRFGADCEVQMTQVSLSKSS